MKKTNHQRKAVLKQTFSYNQPKNDIKVFKSNVADSILRLIENQSEVEILDRLQEASDFLSTVSSHMEKAFECNENVISHEEELFDLGEDLFSPTKHNNSTTIH